MGNAADAARHEMQYSQLMRQGHLTDTQGLALQPTQQPAQIVSTTLAYGTKRCSKAHLCGRTPKKHHLDSISGKPHLMCLRDCRCLSMAATMPGTPAAAQSSSDVVKSGGRAKQNCQDKHSQSAQVPQHPWLHLNNTCNQSDPVTGLAQTTVAGQRIQVQAAPPHLQSTGTTTFVPLWPASSSSWFKHASKHQQRGCCAADLTATSSGLQAQKSLQPELVDHLLGGR